MRVKDICGDRKAGRAGLLPINPSTWYGWVRDGRVPQGCLIGENTRVWPVEVILAIGRPAAEKAGLSLEGDTSSPATMRGSPKGRDAPATRIDGRGPIRGPAKSAPNGAQA